MEELHPMPSVLFVVPPALNKQQRGIDRAHHLAPLKEFPPPPGILTRDSPSASAAQALRGRSELVCSQKSSNEQNAVWRLEMWFHMVYRR